MNKIQTVKEGIIKAEESNKKERQNIKNNKTPSKQKKEALKKVDEREQTFYQETKKIIDKEIPDAKLSDFDLKEKGAKIKKIRKTSVFKDIVNKIRRSLSRPKQNTSSIVGKKTMKNQGYQR